MKKSIKIILTICIISLVLALSLNAKANENNQSINLIERQKISISSYFQESSNPVKYVCSGEGKAKVNSKGVLFAQKQGNITIKRLVKENGTWEDDSSINATISKLDIPKKIDWNYIDEYEKLNIPPNIEGDWEITSSKESVVSVIDYTVSANGIGKSKVKVQLKSNLGGGKESKLTKTIKVTIKEPKLSVKDTIKLKKGSKNIKLRNVPKNASVSWNATNSSSINLTKKNYNTARIKMLKPNAKVKLTANYKGHEYSTVINPNGIDENNNSNDNDKGNDDKKDDDSDGDDKNNISPMEVHFIDVGQGDATLVTCDGHAMLIDGGPDEKGTAIQLYLTKQGIKALDYVLITHYDSDHAGGADVIIQKFECGKVILPDYEQDNVAYRNIISVMKSKNYTAVRPKAGDEYALGSAKITLLSPIGSYGSNSNNNSTCLRIDNGNDSFMFTGDADSSKESALISSGRNLDVDVYQVGHHGSKYSSSESFVKAMSPKYAVISCGVNNSYYHPHAATLNTLRTEGVSVFRTDEQGTVVAKSSGNGITWNMSPSESWKPGEGDGGSDDKDDPQPNPQPEPTPSNVTYILNTNTLKFHKPSCSSVEKMSDKNRKDVDWTRDKCIEEGYSPCGVCKP